MIFLKMCNLIKMHQKMTQVVPVLPRLTYRGRKVLAPTLEQRNPFKDKRIAERNLTCLTRLSYKSHLMEKKLKLMRQCVCHFDLFLSGTKSRHQQENSKNLPNLKLDVR